jgi:hypothetical protein
MAISRNKRRRIQARAVLRHAMAPVQGLPHEARPMREPVERTPKGLISPFYEWALTSAYCHGRGMAYELPDYAGGGQAPNY